jgi:DNA-binding NarL/FixJ family response regulator
VLKDCSDEELVERVLELRVGGAPMSPGIARLVLTRMQRQGRPGSKKIADENSILTEREIEVLSLLARGYLYAEIGKRLGISLNTVTSHIKNSYRKLAVHSGPAAVTRASELGLLRQGDDKA